jgi:hypothetical protein
METKLLEGVSGGAMFPALELRAMALLADSL